MSTLKVKYRVNRALSDRLPSGKYHDDNSISDVINYIFAPEKTPSHYIGGISVNPSNAGHEMEMLSACFAQNHGVRLRHMILSFHAKELWISRKTSYATAYELAYPIAQFYGWHHQIVYAVHEDGNYVHIHFVMNTTDFLTGKKYVGSKDDLYRFLEHIDNILAPLGIAVWFVNDNEAVS